ncbi:acyltransferase ChoActase/COT/CPT [Ramaria rubella]|nr:acyltransferase ChoActase/COT/CPT [Ramaria rubella]
MSSEIQSVSRRLPVPLLRQTLDKYLKSLNPFLRDDEEKGGPSHDTEMSKRVLWAKDFELGLGNVLQNRLLALDKASPYNWLDDNFWMKTAYLQSRASLMVNSNWWCVYQSDFTIPTVPTPERGQYTFWQVRRAAWLVFKMLQYRADLESRHNAASKAQRNAYLKDIPFQLPFYRYRIPNTSCDTLAPLPLRGSPESRKIVVMLRDWCYTVEVLGKDNVPVSASEIENRLWNATHDANSRQERGEKPYSVGVLTAHERNTWAKVREHLLHISPRNREILDSIERSMFVLSLDDYTQSPDGFGEATAIKNVDLDAHIRNASSGIAGHNRWYDKCVSIFVESTSRAGGMGEHSPCDGLVIGALMNYSLSEAINHRQFERTRIPDRAEVEHCQSYVERLDWIGDDWVKERCVEAEQHARCITDDSDASALWFEDYGARWVKDIGKLRGFFFPNMSPDAYTQMAMQLAWYRVQGYFTATYETATTQMFIRGRTETIRSFSTESWLFVKAMMDLQCPSETRLRCLEEAVRTHNVYTRNAIRGRGIDRHLLGLRLLMKEGEEAQLFKDPLFSRSETWKLSTSGLFRGERFLATGFGSPFSDGIGVQYILNPDGMIFGIESKRSCPATSTEQYKKALAESLREMRALCATESRVEHSARL